MDYKKWKKFKRSGGYRRKINKVNSELLQQPEYAQVLSEPGGVRAVNDCGSVQYKSKEIDSLSHSEAEDDSSEHDSNITGFDKDLMFRENIKMWAIRNNIPHLACNQLFEVINNRYEHILPKDARSLLKTNKQEIQISTLGTGYYWHNGLRNQLVKLLENDHVPLPNNLSLNFNIDGLPLYNSSRKQFWPILCTVMEIPCSPLVIGIYAGDNKPSDLEAFLNPLVTELNEITGKGLDITKISSSVTITVPVKIRAFICDSPARAFIKGVVNFNAKHGCMKCTVVGEYSHLSHMVAFLRCDCPKRNNEDFRSKKDEEHHKLDSPLLKLNIDMVEDIPVSDSLHLIDLGVMKRLLIGWRDGNIGKYLTKWCSRDIEKVNQFLSMCRMPKEIHRSVRNIDVLAHWKGSEFRSFFFYLSFIILKDTLPAQAYYHFLHLFCAITICSNETHFKFLSIAESMLENFVEIFKDIYGKNYISSNIHNLTHVVAEVRRFGILQSFNAYPFENKLYVIKNLIRQGNKPLQQVARRLNERFDLEINQIDQTQKGYPFIKIINSKSRSTTKQICFGSFILSTQEQNKWFLSEEGHIIELSSICSKKDHPEDILIHGYRIENIDDVFDEPLRSSYLFIYKTNFNYNKVKVICKASRVKCKLVKIEYNSEIFFVPLLHTL